MVKVKRFTAAWCQPCKVLAPLFSELQSEMPNVVFETIDVDENMQQAKDYVITSVPTIIIEKDNEIVKRYVGIKPKSEYVKTISSLI
jgi:thioredoxin 1